FEKLGWTDSFDTFKEFVHYSIEMNEEVKSINETCITHLSDTGKTLFSEKFNEFKLSYDKTPSKLDFLKFHLEIYYIEPQSLKKRNRSSNDELKKLGYEHGLNQVDFAIYDFIAPKNYKISLSLLGFEIYNDEGIKDYSYDKDGKFPITINNFCHHFGLYLKNYNEIVKGYVQFLMATEIQKMLDDLE